MIIKKYYLVVGVLLMVSHGIYAKRYQNNQQRCATKKDCIYNKKCQCYCSEKGGFREKVANDKPVYVKDDPNRVYCYCKQWDLDSYPGPVERPK